VAAQDNGRRVLELETANSSEPPLCARKGYASQSRISASDFRVNSITLAHICVYPKEAQKARQSHHELRGVLVAVRDDLASRDISPSV